MNTGIISQRYATAFLRYTQERGSAQRVCEQVQVILADPHCYEGKLEEDLEHFITFLRRKSRMSEVRFILNSYVSLYYKSIGVMLSKLVSAQSVDEATVQSLCEVLEAHFGCKVSMSVKVDPSLIGGFVVQVGDYMLDASVRNQIETIRRQFVVQNNRIV